MQASPLATEAFNLPGFPAVSPIHASWGSYHVVLSTESQPFVFVSCLSLEESEVMLSEQLL